MPEGTVKGPEIGLPKNEKLMAILVSMPQSRIISGLDKAGATFDRFYLGKDSFFFSLIEWLRSRG